MAIPELSVIQLVEYNQIWTLTIHRPESLNALNQKVIEEINLCLDFLQTKTFSEARGLILTGAGEKAFVAGADIKQISQLEVASAQRFAQAGQECFRRFENLKIPVLAAVNGFALGGGLELALSGDFIYCSENAKFGLPEVSLGLIPGFGGCVRLSRVVGLNRAREMTLSGEMLNAAQALDCGLVNRVLPLQDLLPAAMKTLELISLRGPVAVAAAKSTILKSFDADVQSAMSLEAEAFSQLFKTADFKEGTSAFVEKRKAQFQGS